MKPITKFTYGLYKKKLSLESRLEITGQSATVPDPKLKILNHSLERTVGFLFNHDATHQVSHIAPIIKDLRKNYPYIKVVAMVSSEAQLERIHEIIGYQDDIGFTVMKLIVPVHVRWIFKKLNTLVPIQRLYILKHYKLLFEKLDCLVVSEMTSAILKTHLGLKTTPIILLPHGAGDRAIGFGKEIKHYDYVLLSGHKVRDRMLNAGLVRANNHSIVGYPKFDTVKLKKQDNYFNNTKLTVLYNPHFDPQLSSWYSMGLDVLEFFASRQDYNLIVAPHIMLFKKRLHISLESKLFKFRKNIPSKYWNCPNIKIDLGSKSSVNMDYTLSADIYLGDVSSQVYEFLYRPRPCLFLNSHQANWFDNPNYEHWHCGPVLDKVSDLQALLENIKTVQKRYHKTQIKRFTSTFDLKEKPSSLRAAQAIVSFLDSRIVSLD